MRTVPRNNISLLLLLVITFILIPNGILAFDYVTYDPSTGVGDCSVHNYPTAPPYPAKWQQYVNPNFHVPLRRVTDSANEGTGTYSTLFYTTYSVGNSNGTRVLILRLGYGTTGIHALYDAQTGAFIKQLVLGGPGSWPRWDDEDPDLLYYSEGPLLKKIDVNTEVAKVVHDFTNGPAGTWIGARDVTLNDKGDASWDRRYWGFNIILPGDSPDENYPSWLVYYDMQTDTITGTLDVHKYYNTYYPVNHHHGIRLATASPSGNYIVVSVAGADQNRLGEATNGGVVDIFDKNYNYLRTLIPEYQLGHMAWGYDTEGYEVLLDRGYADAYYAHRLATGEHYIVFRPQEACATGSKYWDSGNQAGYHMSTFHNVPGWCIVTHYGNYIDDNRTTWLAGEILAFQIKPQGLVWRISHNFGAGQLGYNHQSKGSPSWDGRYLYFDTSWKGTQNTEVFRAELPANWWNEIVEVTPNIPPTASASASPTSGPPSLKVIFTGSGNDPDGNIIAYHWDFGDGTNQDTLESIPHIYTIPGNYTATLTVSDNNGGTGTATVDITVTQGSDTDEPAPPKGLHLVTIGNP